jgi:hypothetical protein
MKLVLALPSSRRERRASAPFAAALVLAATAACGSGRTSNEAQPPSMGSGGGTTMPDDPMVLAYSALEAANYDALPGVIADLDAAFEAHPDRGRTAFYAGTMRLWLATGAPRDLGDRYQDVTGAIEKLERAHALRPTDPHVNAFLGIARTALGNVLGDQALIDTGRQVLDEGIEYYPPYVNGVRTQAFGMLPRDHQHFPDAIDAMYATFQACGLDASAGDDLKIVYPLEEDSPQGTCWNGGVVDHVWEGIFLIYGDVHVKSGDVAMARRLYEAAKLSPTYDTFLYGDELEARIADADARAARYLDGDPDNDPETWMDGEHLCVGCHASKR